MYMLDSTSAIPCMPCQPGIVTPGHNFRTLKVLVISLAPSHYHTQPMPNILMRGYLDPKTGEDAPFITIGHFASKDTLFCSDARDLDLYTAEEAIALRNPGIFKSSCTCQPSPHPRSKIIKVPPRPTSILYPWLLGAVQI